MKITKIDEAGITFDNGSILSHYHSQDCCENVYADWEALKTESGIMEHNFTELPLIEFVKESGIRIEGFFVPCYNSQNGYYSSELEINLVSQTPLLNRQTKVTWDISDCVKDDID